MNLKPDEVAWVIQEEIQKFSEQIKFEPFGRILQVGDGIARIFGLEDVMLAELLEFSNGTMGMALNLEIDNVGAILFGTDEGIKEHSIVKKTGQLVSVPVGSELVGRVINPLGVPLDNKGKIQAETLRPLENKAPSVVQRQPVYEPVETGIKAIDCLVPIGRGQRELIIGDRQTGKTTLIIDTIINQKNKDMICIYVAIGQKTSTIFQTVKILEEHGALEHTIIVSASASEPASLQYIAPYAGTAIGEHFMYQGKHAICFYDDLTRHAISYRQLSLLLRRPAGREAYPGDIFYLHSRLLERSAKLSDELGGGSLTAIPVIETQANDLTTYIPTNVISITDGQIFLESGLMHAGIRPAINVGISVSRVGSKAQPKAMRQVAGSLRLDLAQFVELSAFVQFKSELDEATQSQITRGERLREILNQGRYAPLPLEKQVIIIFIATQGYLDDISEGKLQQFENNFFDYIEKNERSMIETIRNQRSLDPEIEQKLLNTVIKFKKQT